MPFGMQTHHTANPPQKDEMKEMQRIALALAAAAALAGCASGPPFIDQMQPEAIHMAERRGQFEMNCQQVTSDVVSRETLQPLVQTFRYSGPQRAEYTIGVSGCGKRVLYVVICPDNGSGCFAGGARNDVR
jgi:hypothetical protein